MRTGRILGPVILICLGFALLLNNFVLELPFDRLVRDFWPFVLIFFGVLQVLRFSGGGAWNRPAPLTGGLMMIVIGVLFALQTLADIPFGRTWPAILIAAGVAGALRFAGGTAGQHHGHGGGFRQ
jgi:hypothetical protein